jgi:hypothetical protein
MRLIAVSIVVFAGAVMIAAAAIAGAIDRQGNIAHFAALVGAIAVVAGGALFFIEWRAGAANPRAIATPDSPARVNPDAA